jgi:ABC-type transport system involved in multi-copper enzyme maturation permease subunit
MTTDSTATAGPFDGSPIDSGPIPEVDDHQDRPERQGGGLVDRLMAGLRSVVNNPVLRREMDERARSSGSAIALTMWLLLLSCLALLVYFAALAGRNLDPVTADLAATGRNLFEWTVFGMLGLILFLVPAFTASSIAGERTRQTLVPVQMTTMGPMAIVIGKVLASVAFTVLLVVSAAPILAIGVFVGGVGVGDLARGLGMLVLTAVLLGAIGVMCSAVTRRVQTATAVTYGLVILLTVGSFAGLLVWVVVGSAASGFEREVVPPKEILAVNPLVGVADALGGDENFGENPLSGLRGLIDELDQQRAREPQPAFIDQPAFGPFDEPAFEREVLLPIEPVEVEVETTALWRWYLVFLALTVYSSIYIATERIRTPARTER